MWICHRSNSRAFVFVVELDSLESEWNGFENEIEYVDLQPMSFIQKFILKSDAEDDFKCIKLLFREFLRFNNFQISNKYQD